MLAKNLIFTNYFIFSMIVLQLLKMAQKKTLINQAIRMYLEVVDFLNCVCLCTMAFKKKMLIINRGSILAQFSSEL